MEGHLLALISFCASASWSHTDFVQSYVEGKKSLILISNSHASQYLLLYVVIQPYSCYKLPNTCYFIYLLCRGNGAFGEQSFEKKTALIKCILLAARAKLLQVTTYTTVTTFSICCLFLLLFLPLQ